MTKHNPMTCSAADIMNDLVQPPRMAMRCITPLGNTPFDNRVVPQALAQDLRQEHQFFAKLTLLTPRNTRDDCEAFLPVAFPAWGGERLITSVQTFNDMHVPHRPGCKERTFAKCNKRERPFL